MHMTNLKGWSRVEYLMVSDVGQLGAGPAVEFLPSVRKIKIVRPANARSFDSLVAGRISGDSLKDDGILDGDRIICRTNFEMSEVRQGRLVVVRTPFGLLVKHFYLTDDGMVRLASANRKFKDLVFELEEIEVKALVLETSRTWS